MIAALFVLANGPYSGRADVDLWPESRDARLYPGPHSVVAHPPCARWGRLWAMHGRKLGDDQGCFESALASVRRFGGVLEHPAGSFAWPRFGLLNPVVGAWSQAMDGSWTTEVDQGLYGHPARKRTWLLYVGATAPPLFGFGKAGRSGVVLNLVVLFSLLALSGLVWAAWKQEGRLRRLEEQSHAQEKANRRVAQDIIALRAFGPTPAPQPERRS